MKLNATRSDWWNSSFVSIVGRISIIQRDSRVSKEGRLLVVDCTMHRKKFEISTPLSSVDISKDESPEFSVGRYFSVSLRLSRTTIFGEDIKKTSAGFSPNRSVVKPSAQAPYWKVKPKGIETLWVKFKSNSNQGCASPHLEEGNCICYYSYLRTRT